MSVIIKCMKMPAGCMDCNLLYMDRGGAYCMATNNCAEEEGGADQYEDTRPDWCPLIELPVEHGRLIDENEALINYAKMPSMPTPEILAVTKTIIPSEGDKK